MMTERKTTIVYAINKPPTIPLFRVRKDDECYQCLESLLLNLIKCSTANGDFCLFVYEGKGNYLHL